jgi:hypothetical protein
MSSISIDRNIPPPPKGRVFDDSDPNAFSISKYPLNAMAVGDSFFVPGAKSSEFGTKAHVRANIIGRKVTTRTVVEGGVKGVRVWIVK